jgi:hypothetical protein
VPSAGWRRLLAGYPWFRKTGAFPLPAYSEFMPPPRVGRKPCGEIDTSLLSPDDPEGWRISACEEMDELRPGLEHIGHQLIHAMLHLGLRNPAHGVSRSKLENNPYWPAELQKSGAPAHERYVLILPLALSRTQDDKGRVRWTLFGSSEQGPSQPFLRSPGADAFLNRLRHTVYGDSNCLVTFEPFATLPSDVRKAYREGKLHLIPFPGSLLFWGTEGYAALAHELPTAMQIPLLHLVARHEAPGGIRVPQSGWLHEKTSSHPEPRPEHGPFRQDFQRTHRWSKVRRDEDEIATIAPDADKMAHVLFSTSEDDIGLYDKPMARNTQIWDKDHRLVLDGPNATGDELRAAYVRVCAGGTFGYRFFYPPMQVGVRPVYWHRPLVAYAEGGEARVMLDAPTGYLTAYGKREIIELWPRILPAASQTKAGASRHAAKALTFHRTARRAFEVAYWNTIKKLSAGRFINKDNADVVLDRATQKRLEHLHRDLDPLADYLIAHYRKSGAKVTPMPFRWHTDFPFGWSEGWRRNQQTAAERNLIVKIPGRNRKRAVILADHYDTAYMEDVFKSGARIAAPGADDNASATAVLMLAAPIFHDLKLACDVWLVHLTGEEFPSDCLGARHLVQQIVEGAIDVEIAGVFVMDMIAHNNDKHRDIFQISPGEGRRAMQLAGYASEATELWNQLPQGRRRGRGRRSKSGQPPKTAEYPRLRGEVRPHDHPRSTLYNTDAQIFSDAGLPVVLFMENYDIDRHGYHDSHDTMENIDLDYGSALAAIAIETVARAAIITK